VEVKKLVGVAPVEPMGIDEQEAVSRELFGEPVSEAEALEFADQVRVAVVLAEVELDQWEDQAVAEVVEGAEGLLREQ
jgi:hypothetical protein